MIDGEVNIMLSITYFPLLIYKILKSKDLKIKDLEKKVHILIETNQLHQKKVELLESENTVLKKALGGNPRSPMRTPKAKKLTTKSKKLSNKEVSDLASASTKKKSNR